MRTVVITGANAGLGYQTALHFARSGARVVLACRSEEKAALARQSLHREAPGARLDSLAVDVSEPSSLREFADAFAARIGSLHVLVNNAGITARPLARNSLGHELQLATNYLGAFALTGLLLPYFAASGPARIVNVGSVAHHVSKLVPEQMNLRDAEYEQWKAYANSKLAVLSHAFELNRRLRQRESNIIALGAHPGIAGTDILYKSESLRPKNAFSRWSLRVASHLVPGPARAAASLIHAADSVDAEGGDYYGPRLELAGMPARARVSAASRDISLAQRLWSASEALTGVRYLS